MPCSMAFCLPEQSFQESYSTISCIKTAYEQDRARKRERDNKEDVDVPVLPQKKRGKHVLLGERLDECVQK